MSVNIRLVAIFCVLALVAGGIRLVCGPIPDLAGDESLYAMAKAAPPPAVMDPEIQMAVSGAPPLGN